MHRLSAELQPNLDDMPPKFVAAITSMLPDDLDITISSPLVNDEKYWKRVCVEGKVGAGSCNPWPHAEPLTWQRCCLDGAAMGQLRDR